MLGQAGVLLAGLAAGAAIAWVYFKTLWLSVQRMQRQRHPALWMTATLFLRLAAAAGAFVLTAVWGGWRALLACLLGFTLARIVVVRRLRGGGDAEAGR